VWVKRRKKITENNYGEFDSWAKDDVSFYADT